MVTVQKGLKAVRLVKPYAKEPDTEEEEEADKEDEEEEEEEEEEVTDHAFRVPVVGELPLDVQGFRRIHDQGPQGMTMPVCSFGKSYVNLVLANHLVTCVCVCVCACWVFLIFCPCSQEEISVCFEGPF